MSQEKYRKVQKKIDTKIKIEKDGNESVVIIFYTIKFVNSARFIAASLSYFADNLTEGIYKIKCKNVIVFLNMKVSRTIK